jgi:hypothetical protein
MQLRQWRRVVRLRFWNKEMQQAVTTEQLWEIIAGARNGIPATLDKDGTPQDAA